MFTEKELIELIVFEEAHSKDFDFKPFFLSIIRHFCYYIVGPPMGILVTFLMDGCRCNNNHNHQFT